MAQTGAPTELTARQHKVMAALLQARTVREASQSTGVPERTIHRWLADDPEFTRQLAAAERELLGATLRGLVRLARPAIGVLSAILADEMAGPSARLRAASIILERLVTLRGLVDLEERVSKLEEAANGQPE